MPRFPVALSATGVRFLVILSRWGAGPPLRLAYRHLRQAGPQRGFHVPHARAATGLGAA